MDFESEQLIKDINNEINNKVDIDFDKMYPEINLFVPMI